MLIRDRPPFFVFRSRSRPRSLAAFTLMEIMVVVGLLALLAAIAVPSHLRSRKRSQATHVLNDLRMLDNALDRWAVENNKQSGETATFTDIKPYLKNDTSLWREGRDVFGHEFGPTFSVDAPPKVPSATKSELSTVTPAEFWSPYQ